MLKYLWYAIIKALRNDRIDKFNYCCLQYLRKSVNLVPHFADKVCNNGNEYMHYFSFQVNLAKFSLYKVYITSNTPIQCIG